jgi:sorbitol-6-phosphate 2-dehydrogenase
MGMDRLIYEILPALRMIFSENGICSMLYHEQADIYEHAERIHSENEGSLLMNAIFLKEISDARRTIAELSRVTSENEKAQCIFLPGKGTIFMAGNPKSCLLMRDSLRLLLDGKIEFSNDMYTSIPDNAPVAKHLVSGKIAVVTGGAMGFGEGIIRDLYANGANVVIADINQAMGTALAEELNTLPDHVNRALFVPCDVSVEKSVQEMIWHTVAGFGGLDILISNAGILRAGGLDEMDFETFELATKINYSGYFLCAKYAAEVMKRQHEQAPAFFMDIIQINSKSGLRGSNRNFTYAGGKFGGIGLTQSFALELMPYRIKVNAICPGNFFEGPLWSDPTSGLFVQYLKTGKVPHAKTLEDVKKHYEGLIPANRGCSVRDVMKAIYYVIDQEYETGQAIPVTGGQVMLS